MLNNKIIINYKKNYNIFLVIYTLCYICGILLVFIFKIRILYYNTIV